jgi:hypothetical protein
MRCPHNVIARSEATKQSSFVAAKLDCFAEHIERRFVPIRWLAMPLLDRARDHPTCCCSHAHVKFGRFNRN